MLTLGIDDAGRGPVIGPMVLAGCLVDEQTEKELKKLGVKDSKKLTQKRREFLVEEIKKKAEAFEVTRAFPDEIDGNNYTGTNLNDVEAIMTAEIINKINKGFAKLRVIVDCPSPSIEKWRDFLKTKIDNLSNLDLICEHKADVNHVSVSAASIIAKIVREKEMDILKQKYGDEIGSGYCSDKKTTKFLEDNVIKLKKDGLFRKTWKTCQNAEAKKQQTKLSGFEK